MSPLCFYTFIHANPEKKNSVVLPTSSLSAQMRALLWRICETIRRCPFLSKCSLVISFRCRPEGFDSITDSFGRGQEPITSRPSGGPTTSWRETTAQFKFQIVFHHWGSSWAPAGEVSHSQDDSLK